METTAKEAADLVYDKSPTRLEGMETDLKLDDQEAVLASPTRLEGMETWTKREVSLNPSRLRPALRGWKRNNCLEDL